MNKLEKPVAVLAGTPVDTKMGADMLEACGIRPIMFPVSRDPVEQACFQVRPQEEKYRVLRQILQTAVAGGCESVFVYCNSLSGSVRFSVLAEELGLKIITPMDIYGELARNYGKVAVIAATSQALAGQEHIMLNSNPQILVMSAAMLPTVLDIEARYAPEEIVRRNHLDTLMTYFEQTGCEALLLGCTHFPYIRDALAACTALPIIDPAEEMVKLLRR